MADYIVHFNTRIKCSDRNKLTRENYCIPTRNISWKNKKNIQIAEDFFEQHKRYPRLCPSCYQNIPNDVFADSEHFTEEFVAKHYRDCVENFDLNMRFFSRIEKDKFERHLNSFARRNRFKEIDDLKIVSGVEGIYIMVLDEYKQVYIGVSGDIKKRILAHWTSKKDFEHLLCGAVYESILSIDSFGALDTTRIFYKPCSWWEKDKAEEKYISKFSSKYRLNRMAGGINGEADRDLREVMLLANVQTRDLNI